MKYRFRIIYILRKIYFDIYFKINRINASRKFGVRIGDNCVIYGGNINMWGSEPFLITVGNNVFITDGCKFINHDGGTLPLRKFVPDLEITKEIKIGNDVYMGIDTIIMPGVVIGNNVIIGARSVVTKNLESNGVYAGTPAKYIKSVEEYLEKLKTESLKIGHLNGDDKEKMLKKIFNV